MNYEDKRVLNGYGSMLLYKLVNESRYHLLIPLETVPGVVGSTDTSEFDLLTSKTKGKLQGKATLEDKEVEFLWHRDNILRLEALVGQTLDFLTIYPDYTARAFSGTIQVRSNDAEGDILKGTFTISPISAETTTILDCRELIQDTIMITSAIPSIINLDVNTNEYLIKFNTNVEYSELVVEFEKGESFGYSTGTEGTTTTLTITKNSSGASMAYDLLKITPKQEGYASWTTTIALSGEFTPAASSENTGA